MDNEEGCSLKIERIRGFGVCWRGNVEDSLELLGEKKGDLWIEAFPATSSLP